MGNLLLCLFSVLVLIVKGGNGLEFDRCPPKSHQGGDLKVYGSKCYQFIQVEKYWHEGRQFCRDGGGDLITIHRRDIQVFVEKSLKEIGYHNNGVWIGATDMHQEEDWKWVTGQSVRTGYQNWDNGQPSCWMPLIKDLCKEDCACLRLDEGFKWHDYFCAARHFEYGFICQYDMLPQPTEGPNVAANTLKMVRNESTTTSTTTRETTTSPKPVVVTLTDVKATDMDGDYAKSGADSQCHYGNKTYQNGDQFKDLDDCNTCHCYNGHVGCTEMACIKDTVNCFYDNVWYNNGDEVKVTNDCQWCYCKNGEVKCSPGDCKNKDDAVQNKIGVLSHQVSSQEEGMKTGSLVGMVVAFLLVFIAGIIIGVLVCKRRYKKRYEENVSAGFSNVLYTPAPQQTEVKQTALYMSEQESDFEEDPPHYTSIDNICVPPPYTEAAASGSNIYDDVAEVKKVKPDDVQVDERELTVDLPPAPCGMSAALEINQDPHQQPADGISEAYSNNLYGVQ